jgi:lipopolysaccharide transport system ATP-binding protein
MQDMQGDGRTVLFVSHQMSMITALCKRGIVLTQGSIAFDGRADQATIAYQSLSGDGRGCVFDPVALGLKLGDDRATLQRVWLEDAHGISKETYDIAELILIKMSFTLHLECQDWPSPNIQIYDSSGKHLCVVFTKEFNSTQKTCVPGSYVATCEIPPNLVNTGNFSIGVALIFIDSGVSACFWEPNALTFQTTEDFESTLHTTRNGYSGPIPGTIRPSFRWHIETVNQPVGVAS